MDNAMVELVFGALSVLDIAMAVLTGVVGSVSVAAAYSMSRGGYAKWIPRKLVHVANGSVIGLTIVGYSNLSGPLLAVVIFATVLIYAWAHKSSLISELLVAGSRDGETGLSTFFSGFMGLVAFAMAFLFFLPHPEIFTAAILSVSWADGSGEVFGRTFGGRFFRRRIKGKSFEGTIAVFLFALVSVIISLAIYSDLSPLLVIPQTLVVGLLIALTELFSKKWMDNFLLPLVTSFAMWILMFPQMLLFGLFSVL